MSTEPPAESRQIRVGVMGNGRAFPKWQAETLSKLLEIPEVEISLLIVPRKKSDRPGRFSRLLGEPKHLLWNLYNKGYIQRRSNASRPVDLSIELGATPELACTVVPVGKYGESLSDKDIATIEAANLDLILRFGFGILKGAVLSAARFGIWSFHHGDEREYRGQPPGFWEIVEGETTIGTILQRITERLDGGAVLHRGRFGVVPQSYRRTRDEAFLGATDFPSIVVRQILNGDLSIVEAPPSKTEAPLRRSPGNATMIGFLWHQTWRFLGAQWRGLGRASKWTIGIAEVPVASLLAGEVPRFDWVAEQGSSRYLADPFPDPTGQTSFVLVEDYDHDGHRGVISAVDIKGDRKARTVLDPGVHASYPFLFESEGVVYCVPETYQAAEVRLYRTSNYPDSWELAGTILQGKPVLDPTIFRHDNRWWLFCTMEGRHSNTKLFAFHSPDLLGPWEPHSLNPVKTDVSSSRPGGVPFVHEGVLYRPAQDSSESYGGAVVINRVDALTPDTFNEYVVRRIGPPTTGRYQAGIHTISGDDNITVVDGRRDVFVFSSFRREFAGRVKRLFNRG